VRHIDTIIIHCAATKPSMDIGVEEIRVWHTKERGWSDIGYHFVIRRNGEVETGRPVAKVGAHARGHNVGSIGVCLVGGMAEADTKSECNYTRAQWASLDKLVTELELEYSIKKVLGHNDVSAKDCPTFNAHVWAK
jgi:N-acetylmuramoyl-L-alanine amidase